MSTPTTIHDILSVAVSKGVMYPKVRISSFQFSPSKYPSTTYVKHRSSREYMGKIVGDKFFPVSRWVPTHNEITQIEQIITSPILDSIAAHGIQTGQCSFCGRVLLAASSIAAQIGPVCAEKYGISIPSVPAPTERDLGF